MIIRGNKLICFGWNGFDSDSTVSLVSLLLERKLRETLLVCACGVKRKVMRCVLTYQGQLSLIAAESISLY